MMQEFQSVMNQIAIVFAIIIGGMGVIAVVVGKIAAKRVRDEYEEAGGNRQLVKNIATKGAAAILKRVIKSRFR